MKFALTLSFDDFDHFAALIDTAVRTRTVSADLYVAIRAFPQVRNFQGVMSPAGRRTTLRMAPFWIRHDFLLSQFLKD